MKTIFTLLIFLSSLILSSAQSVGINLTLTYIQKADDTYILKATVTDEEAEEPVEGIEIEYSVSINGESTSLGSSATAANGISQFNGHLEELRIKGHQFIFVASFAGNEGYDENEVEREITDAKLALKVDVVDSVNTVFVSLNSWNENNELAAISDEDIKLFVPRMYSLLPITEAYTNEEGEDEVEFPNDIPGGPNGELMIIGKLEEHESYGTIEAEINTKWGLPVSLDINKLPRALWSPDAPLWMVITFIILMTGVWGHYFLIVYNLFRIKKSSIKNAPITYSE